MPRVIVGLFLTLGLVSSVEAQTTPKGVYSSMSACEAGTENYTPSFLTGHKPLGAGEFRAPLGRRQCGEMIIAGGRRAIIGQAATDEMVWKGSPTDPSNAVVNRRWDCGNGAWNFRLIVDTAPAPIQVVTPTPAPTPAPARSKTDWNKVLDDFNRNNRMTIAQPRRDWGWLKPVGITAGVLGIGLIAANNWPDKRPDRSLSGGQTNGATLRISLP